jgi:superfamily I DNA/RNA helicase
MTLESTRAVLRSALRVVVVEAAGGCGKTHEAVEAALDWSREVKEGQEVLLLAHTNAAVREFRKRVASRQVPIRVSTLDAFALEIVSSFSISVGLPEDIRIGAGVDFSDLAPKLHELLTKSPTTAEALTRHYPIVIFDEHQDASKEQHEILRHLSRHGSLVRVFGDPVQGIYDWDASPVTWAEVTKDADKVAFLSEPRRWRQSPKFGTWIVGAREVLAHGGKIERLEIPSESVFVHVLNGFEEPSPFHGPLGGLLIWKLRKVLEECLGRTAVLVRNGRHEQMIRRALPKELALHEGADYADAYKAFNMAIKAGSSSRELALAAIQLMNASFGGMTKTVQKDLNDSLKADRLDAGKKKKILPLLRRFEPLYESPTLTSWCRMIGDLAVHPPAGLTLHRPRSLGAIRNAADLSHGDDPEVVFDEVVRQMRMAVPMPDRSVMTIHKSKGHEFTNVIVPICGAASFPDDDEGRRLLYVAMSRACARLHLIVPEHNASPLLEL